MKKDQTGIEAKKAAGYAAAQLVQEGMLVGLGTGTTARFFIENLIQRCRHGLRITAVATSTESSQLAQSGGIRLLSPGQLDELDLAVDGADEIDPHKCMIKGGGGALVRERIVASASKEMIVIVDSTKVVKKLGAFPLPVEIIPFGYQATLRALNTQGYTGLLRHKQGGTPYITDNGNYIFDIHFKELLTDPAAHHRILKGIAGVVDTGLFIGLAGRVIVGYPDGHTAFLAGH